ncbi:hypothetical protein jhhlp_002290 [Lomentospora prolificans]|uniref:Glutaredoxin domain-containing protein n=1 Tax=Lomentospora prolificans TaxID=41688 RepID=A0A2N3NDJ2_9PEZI|nr:hypothetical protein jhhlp_002290 [Lomentospora prolificans]
MPSPRRMRLLCVAVLAGIIMTILWTSHQQRSPVAAGRDASDLHHQGHIKDRHRQTVLDPQDIKIDREPSKGDPADSNEVADRLKDAEKKAKEIAQAKAPLKPDSPSLVVGVGSSADGQDAALKQHDPESGTGGAAVGPSSETEEEHEAEQELRSILKKAPVIIFSKTYCGFSKRAKVLLMERYVIDPPPFVVELDVHPLGPELQDLLKETTGRGTVPNIMVNGVSIGGSDDIAELDRNGELIAKVQDLGEARQVSMKLRS